MIAQFEQFKQALTAKKIDLQHRLRQRDDLQIEHFADELDNAEAAVSRETVGGQLQHARKTLLEVNAALDRLSDASFGVCQDCEEPIKLSRLTAVPWASKCAPCKQRDEDSAKQELQTNI